MGGAPLVEVLSQCLTCHALLGQYENTLAPSSDSAAMIHGVSQLDAGRLDVASQRVPLGSIRFVARRIRHSCHLKLWRQLRNGREGSAEARVMR